MEIGEKWRDSQFIEIEIMYKNYITTANIFPVMFN